mgnify:CR=1 FL=1
MRQNWVRIIAIILAVLMALSGLGVGLSIFIK